MFKNEEYEELLDILKNEHDENPGNHWILLMISTVNIELGNFEEAHDALSKGIKSDGKCPLLWWDLACVLEGLGDIEDAITVWEEIITYESKTMDFDGKDSCWESVSCKNGLVINSYYRIGFAYLELNMRDLAKDYLTKFLEKKITFDDNEIDSTYDPKYAIELFESKFGKKNHG